jgi:ribosomal protein S18 acetylase RimI-like enzyme
MIVTVPYDENQRGCIKMLNDYTQEKKPEALASVNRKISLAYEVSGEIIGRLVGKTGFNCLTIELFAVDGKKRSSGVGSQLLAEAEAIAISEGCHLIFLETFSFNAPKFYIKKGFSVMREVENSPIKGQSHFFMIKEL